MVANAIFQRYALISLLNAKLMGIEILKGQYVDDLDFALIYVECA